MHKEKIFPAYIQKPLGTNYTVYTLAFIKIYDIYCDLLL